MRVGRLWGKRAAWHLQQLLLLHLLEVLMVLGTQSTLDVRLPRLCRRERGMLSTGGDVAC